MFIKIIKEKSGYQQEKSVYQDARQYRYKTTEDILIKGAQLYTETGHTGLDVDIDQNVDLKNDLLDDGRIILLYKLKYSNYININNNVGRYPLSTTDRNLYGLTMFIPYLKTIGTPKNVLYYNIYPKQKESQEFGYSLEYNYENSMRFKTIKESAFYDELKIIPYFSYRDCIGNNLFDYTGNRYFDEYVKIIIKRFFQGDGFILSFLEKTSHGNPSPFVDWKINWEVKFFQEEDITNE